MDSDEPRDTPKPGPCESGLLRFFNAVKKLDGKQGEGLAAIEYAFMLALVIVVCVTVISVQARAAENAKAKSSEPEGNPPDDPVI